MEISRDWVGPPKALTPVSAVSGDDLRACVVPCNAIDCLHSFLEIWWPTKEMKANILQKFLKRQIFSTFKANEGNFTSVRKLITKIYAFSSVPLFSSKYTSEVTRFAFTVLGDAPLAELFSYNCSQTSSPARVHLALREIFARKS
jgi:hypothetical protein